MQMIPRLLPWVIGWINQYVKHRGDTGLGENNNFGLKHVASGLFVGQVGRDVWNTHINE